MSTTSTYIPDDIAQRINDTAELAEIAGLHVSNLKQKRTGGYEGDCPFCQGKKKFGIFRDKKDSASRFDAYKCFVCDQGGKGSAKFLMAVKRITYPEALAELAAHYHIEVEAEVKERTLNGKPKHGSFRDAQLLQSGIPEAAQQWQHQQGETKWVERNRYEAGSLTNDNRITGGDDMLLNYLALDGKPLMFRDKAGKERPLVRVRWQHPHNHLDKQGKPMKYKSLPGSPSALWLPQALLKAYAQTVEIETLYISEGEKKADKMCLHGMYTVGLQGINNLSTFEGMTSTFEQIIQRCKVKRVVFVLDSDWHDIGSGEDVDYRPKSFFSAVKKFRSYFYGYKNSQIELDIWLAYGLDKVEKGIDDLLVHTLKGNETALAEDFTRSMTDREGKGAHVNALNITTISEHKLLELWHLQTPAAFIEHHIEELRPRKTFRINGYLWEFDQEGKPQLVEKILDHEKYWGEEEITDRAGFPVLNKEGNPKLKLSFDYYQSLQFLRNRGFNLFEIQEGEENYRLVHVAGKVVKETTPHKIQQYVKDFTEQLGRIDVLNMLLRGGPQYLGPNNLSNLYYVRPEFLQPEKEQTMLVFKNCFWRITADGIEERKLTELDRHVWENRIVDFEPKLMPPMLTVNREGENWKVKETDDARRCEMYLFHVVTSDYWWRKRWELQKDEEGIQRYVAKANPEKYHADEVTEMTAHLVCKMLATGYTLQGYRNKAQMKAIVAMDGVETEVGKSQGGTGKSIDATKFQYLTPTFVIDGKKPTLEQDPFVFDGLDERHGVLVFDDVRVNFNFEWLFSKITTGIEANWKNRQKLFLQPMPTWVVTNHALNGEGNSFTRRQYLISFSDFFNGNRTPFDVFGHQLFEDWDHDQWNLFYNYMAVCIQTYLRFNDLNKYVIPQGDLERRKLRQMMGETFLEFAEVYFAPTDNPFGFDAGSPTPGYRNIAISKDKVLRDYLEENKGDGKWMNTKRVKEKTRLYCQYKGLSFCPNAGADGRLKHNGVEYLVVADEDFNANDFHKVA